MGTFLGSLIKPEQAEVQSITTPLQPGGLSLHFGSVAIIPIHHKNASHQRRDQEI